MSSRGWRTVDDLPELGLPLVPPGSEPVGAYLAPERLDDLPRGVWHGEVDPAELPAGPSSALAGVLGQWTVRVLGGTGWALREGKGPPRGDGTRPKLRILEPCTTISLRAVAFDPEWDDVSHHVLIGWCRIARTGKSGPDMAWLWSREPTLDGAARAFRRNPRACTLSEAAAVLAGPPTDAALSTAYAPGDRERGEDAMRRTPVKP